MRICRTVASCLTSMAMAIRVILILTVAMMVGCQSPQPGIGVRMVEHAALINSTGLATAQPRKQINVTAAIPLGWEMMDTDTTSLYTHQQWRSPNHATGLGVVYLHLPLPMSAKTLVWLAKSQYSKLTAKQHRPDDSQLLGEWTDSLGREWFEGENQKYHVKGYIVTNGFDAWAVYSGYRLKSPPNNADINLAYRGMDSIVPLPLEKQTSIRR